MKVLAMPPLVVVRNLGLHRIMTPGPLMRLAALLFCALLIAACSEPTPSAPPSAASSSLTAYELRCEMRVDPLGIDTREPRLSWKLKSDRQGQGQGAYRIIVAGNLGDLERGAEILWDSGQIDSAQSLHVEYAGTSLASRQACVWKVMVWDEKGQASPWSRPARWEMGLLDPKDWVARWIDDGKAPLKSDAEHYLEDPAPLMRRDFDVKGKVARARLYVSGLGYYEAWINGRRVGDRMLDPIWTDYDRRVFYSSYDVSDHIRPGRNALGAVLGNGWYNPLPIRMWGHLNLRERLPIGRPCLIAQLEVEYEDGRRSVVATDSSWRQAPGPLLRNNIYLGEVYDARRERPGWNTAAFDASDWQPVSPAKGPKGSLQSQPLEPIRIIEELPAVKRNQVKPGTYIFDFGENFAGWARLSVTGPAGTRVRMRFGELLHSDGSLNPLTAVCGQVKAKGRGGEGAPDVAVQECSYVLRGGGPETFTPRFSFQGFRYVELSGYPGTPPLDCLRGLRLSCDVAEIGTFASSNETLNRIHEMVRDTFLSNLFGLQSDCPHRERFGYGGDIVATADAFLMNLDMASFYPKVVLDLADSTSEENPAFAMTAPDVGIAYAGLEDGHGPIGWSLAHPLLVRELYRYGADRRLIEQQYPAICRWLEYLQSHAVSHIIEKGLSDHESRTKKPVRESSTAFFALGARIAADLAAILGLEADAKKWSALAHQIRAAFEKTFVKETSGVVGIGNQAAQAMALSYDMVSPSLRAAVTKRLVELLREADLKLDTGIFGTQALLEALSRQGHADLAYQMVVRKEFPGWGFMLANDATTLWEHWELSEDTFSHNHPMFGSVSAWMYRWLAGIAAAPDAVGFDSVLLRPHPVEGLDWVRATINSARGPIRSAWKKEGKRLTWTFALPPGSRGVLSLPSGYEDWRDADSSRPVAEIEGLQEVGPGRFEVASGLYELSALSKTP